MPAQILPFPGRRPSFASPIARYLRIGDNHKPLASFPAGGRLPIDRAVFDAFRFERRCDCAVNLREADVLKDPRGHGVRQRAEAVSALERVPDLLRPSHVLDGLLVEAERLSHGLGRLRPSRAVAGESKVDRNESMDRLQRKARTGVQVAKVMRHMDEQRGGEWTRSRPIVRQPSPGPLFRQGRP